MPEFHFYTSIETKRAVGLELIQHVKKDIVYHQLKHQQPQLLAPSRGDQLSLRPQPPAREAVLFWNGGEPDYKRV